MAGAEGSASGEVCETPDTAADGGVRVAAEGGEVHALGLEPPFARGAEVKIVWRVTGTGDVDLAAISPSGERVLPIKGPLYHSTSTFDRPGDEWGSVFVFEELGCWELRIERGGVVGHVAVLVS